MQSKICLKFKQRALGGLGARQIAFEPIKLGLYQPYLETQSDALLDTLALMFCIQAGWYLSNSPFLQNHDALVVVAQKLSNVR